MVCLVFEPGTAGGKVQTKPKNYDSLPISNRYFTIQKSTLKHFGIYLRHKFKV